MAQRDILEEAQKTGAIRIEFLPISNKGLERSACDAHYSMGDQEELARRIEMKIDADLPYSKRR